MFVPSSAQTSTAYRLGGWPRTAWTPADATSMSFRLPVKRRKRPSAMGLRQMLPVQTKRTFFTGQNARLAVLSREHFLSFVSSNPNVALEMLTALTNRLRHTDELLRHTATRNVNVEEAAQLTLADRAADLIAEFGGSWKFFLAAVVVVNVWVWINMWLAFIGKISFDPYPFLLMSTAINVLSILQAPIILMSQNRQSHKDRLRAEIDYQVNLKNELALNEILEHLKALEHKYRDQRVDEYDVSKVE